MSAVVALVDGELGSSCTGARTRAIFCLITEFMNLHRIVNMSYCSQPKLNRIDPLFRTRSTSAREHISRAPRLRAQGDATVGR